MALGIKYQKHEPDEYRNIRKESLDLRAFEFKISERISEPRISHDQYGDMEQICEKTERAAMSDRTGGEYAPDAIDENEHTRNYQNEIEIFICARFQL